MQHEENPMDDIGLVPHCTSCGSERVSRDAWACWNQSAGIWELEHVFDDEHCHQCEGQTRLIWTRPEVSPRKIIVELNDQLRTTGTGGSIMFTQGIQACGEAFLKTTIEALRSFDDFSQDNDPWGEHDFGGMDVEGKKVFWKIDYYDHSLENGSPNAANPGVTKRVLTVMLASEY